MVLQQATALVHREDSQRIVQFAAQHVEVCRDIIQSDTDYLDYGLDAGETQAILLASKLDCPVLMDEKRGRTAARRSEVLVLGTVGLLLAAKQEGLIEAISPLLDQMLAHEYRLALPLVARARALAGEE